MDASRDELLARARQLGVEHPENMTRAELVATLAKSGERAAPRVRPAKPTSWFELARQLLAAVVEQGLNMPDAAALIRGEARLSEPPKPQPPLATVTLAKIYAAQGHTSRALTVLNEVLKAEPDHPAALELRAQLLEKQGAPEAPRAAKGLAPQNGAGKAQVPLAAEAPAAPDENELEGGAADVLVALAKEGSPFLIAWELSEDTEAARVAGNAVHIEWTEFQPAWSGPTLRTTCLSVERRVGSLAVPAPVRSALVSGALGFQHGAQLVPLATLAVAEVSASQPLQIALVRESQRAAVAEAAARAWQRAQS